MMGRRASSRCLPRMPGRSGIDLARTLRERDPGLPILILSGAPEVAREAAEFDLAFLAKPFDNEVLQETIARLVAEHGHRERRRVPRMD